MLITFFGKLKLIFLSQKWHQYFGKLDPNNTAECPPMIEVRNEVCLILFKCSPFQNDITHKFLFRSGEFVLKPSSI